MYKQKAAFYYAGFAVLFLKSCVAHLMDVLLRRLLCRVVTEESRRRSGGGEAGLIDANTMSHDDHVVITLPSGWLGSAWPQSVHSPTVQSGRGRGWGLSEPRPRPLAVVVGGLHLEDVGDDAVNLHVPDEAGKEQLLGDGGADQPQGRQTQQQLGQPGGLMKDCSVVKTVHRSNACCLKSV